MAAVAHNPKFAKKVGVPMSVGKEFNKADIGIGVLGKMSVARRRTGKRGS